MGEAYAVAAAEMRKGENMAGIDLHMHSSESDGTLTPAQLAACAAQNGICAAAITDHDTVSGVAEFKRACAQLGVEAVSGVEISAKYKTKMHILGLFIDESNPELKKRLDYLKKTRLTRNSEILDLMRKHGIDITAADITGQKEDGRLESMGRVHIARALVKKGYAPDIQNAFDMYLLKGKSYYVQRKLLEPEECIQLIKGSGGIAVLAHPCFITKDKDKLYKLLDWLKSMGLDGVESWYSEYTPEYRDLCMEFCAKFGLVPTGGSDFHGENKPHIKIGTACGEEEIPYSLLEGVKRKLERN